VDEQQPYGIYSSETLVLPHQYEQQEHNALERVCVFKPSVLKFCVKHLSEMAENVQILWDSVISRHI
jgi:hypothetical protein